MCLPTRVMNPGAVKAKGLFTMFSKKPVVAALSRPSRTSKSLATFRTGHFHQSKSPRGEPKSEMTACPVITYFSILSMFTTIVYLNLNHSDQRMKNGK